MNDKITHYTPTETVPAHVAGRNRLEEWQASQPPNYFTADSDLQRKLELYLGKEKYVATAPHLYKFGQTAASEIDPLVREANLPHNNPVLNRFDGFGRRVEDVEFHPSHHAAGRLIYGGRPMAVLGEMGNWKLALSLFYLSSQNGEAGHNCPLACTAGIIKVLQHVAPAPLREKYLGRLLDPNYDTNFNGAQYLTEVQGGSDVGANSVWARPEDTDSDVWYLTGEKWFCSNVTADLALVTARMGHEEGTRGLGLFLVPRHLENGEINNFTIRRLKDKLGTRSMASAELDFRDALGYHVGSFKDALQHVINTSRIYNAIGCTANGRRALTIAWTYAQNRLAFGQPIIRFPLVQAQLARMRTDCAAMLAGSLRIAKVMDDIELGRASEADRAFFRMAVNLNKYRTAVLAHEVIMTAIEILGGNGAIESFSVLPRLLRDNIVFENWEGTHNVLLAQVQRDIRKYAIHEPFLAHIRQLFQAANFPELKLEGLAQVEIIAQELGEVLAMDELTAAIYFRPLMDRLTDLYYTACMAAEAVWELLEKEDKSKQRMAIFNLNQRVRQLRPGQIAYYDDQVSRLSSAI
ncbi:MAG: acyl-CoA dehydrogenase family protein [Chloroflexi bacterium]|nr:acyl-CoA dehydrogenase family protein [Chloroflexota bacterium]